jgi:hypothetical protein
MDSYLKQDDIIKLKNELISYQNIVITSFKKIYIII